MRIVGFILGMACFVMAGTPVVAQDLELSTVEKRNQQRAVLFTPYDTDFNGFLDGLEVQELIIAYFKGWDLDNDHVIKGAEKTKAIERFEQNYAYVYGAQTEKLGRVLEHRFKNADDNENDEISFVEYQAYFVDRYGRMDIDKDGLISLEEFRSVVEKVTPKR